MKIQVLQIENEKKNEFEITYDNKLQYYAKLPFVSINEPMNLEKIRHIKIFDPKGNEIYTTDYNYFENLKEEFIPMKFLITGSQKFNQLQFVSNKNIIKLYYEENEIWNNRYVIEFNDKKFFCYSIEDGYIRHFPIYDGELQIGEALKSNIVINGKDEYYCYLKDEYSTLSDGVVALLLYLDRSNYSSSYLVNRSYTLSKNYSYNKTNKFYDKQWVINNFGDEFYKKVNEDKKLFKSKIWHPIKTFKEQLNSMSEKDRKLLLFVLIAPWALILIFGILALIIVLLLLNNY